MSGEETVTISRAEYENMQAQIQWLMEQLLLSRQKRYGASSERSSEDAMEQLSLLFNEAERSMRTRVQKRMTAVWSLPPANGTKSMNTRWTNCLKTYR